MENNRLLDKQELKDFSFNIHVEYREGDFIMGGILSPYRVNYLHSKRILCGLLQHHRLTHNYEIPFGLFADLQQIEIFRGDFDLEEDPILILDATKVFSFYDEDYGKKRIFYQYFECLIQIWLDDCSFHWKSKNPPAFEELTQIGLYQILQDSFVKVPFEDDGPCLF